MKAYTTRFITGLAIITAGALLLLSNLELLNARELIQDWWPLAVIVAGVLIFINDAKSYLWAIFVVGVGVVLQLRELDVVTVSPWQFFWPAVIIFVGVSVILNRSAASKHTSSAERDDATAVMGGSDQRNMSDDYKGGKATAIMGGIKIDLRKATIKKEATIEVFGFWGGIEIVVPRNVVIKNQTSAILGGVENKTDQDATPNAPTLYITGDVIMAGVEIKN